MVLKFQLPRSTPFGFRACQSQGFLNVYFGIIKLYFIAYFGSLIFYCFAGKYIVQSDSLA